MATEAGAPFWGGPAPAQALLAEVGAAQPAAQVQAAAQSLRAERPQARTLRTLLLAAKGPH
eukprot:10520098-Lingulodinium_polyedra.AAC.1